MATDYIIPGVTAEQVLLVLQDDDDMVVIDNGDNYIIEMPIDPRYSLTKRMAIAKMVKRPGDDIEQGGDRASIFLDKTKDEKRCWFTGCAVCLRHPELILDRIVELLDAHGLEAHWLSEHDEEFERNMEDS